MKKFITVSILSASLLALTLVNVNKNIILYTVSSSLNADNTYTDTVQDENGNRYTLKSFDDIEGQWLDATIKNNQEIVSYTFLK